MSELQIPCVICETGEDFLDVDVTFATPEDPACIWLGVEEGGHYGCVALDVNGAMELAEKLAAFLRSQAEEVTK